MPSEDDTGPVRSRSRDGDDGLLSGTGHLEYDSRTGTYVTHFDDGYEASVAVVSVVSAIGDVDPLEMDQLGHSVDPDALDSLVGFDSDAGTCEVGFAYAGYDVTVASDGRIAVRPSGLVDGDRE
jgi:hypothetical protein